MKDDLTTVLRGMDPADPDASAGSDRAQRDLTTILATRHDRDEAQPAHAAPRRRSRYVLAAAAAVVVAVGVGLPALAPGAAYAGWVAQPQQASVPIARDAEERCQELWASVGLDPLPDEDEASSGASYAEPTALRGVLTERRGPWTFTILRGEDGQLGDCLFSRDGFFGESSGGGSMTGAPKSLDPNGADVDQAVLGAVSGSRRSLGPLRWGDDSSMVYTYGRAGEDVAAVTLHTAEHGPVQASVQNGIWAAWWPSGSEPTMPWETLVATVTATDGSAREVDLATLGWDHSEEE